MRRFFIDIGLFLSLAFFPWWVALALAFIAALFFESFYEILFAGLLLDLIGSFPVPALHGFTHVFLAAAILLFLFSRFFRSRTVFYRGAF